MLAARSDRGEAETVDEAATHDFPDTPAAQAAAWFLRHAATQGRDLTLEEVAEHMHFDPPWTAEDSLRRFREETRDDSRKIDATNSVSPYEFEYFETDSRSRRWRALVRVTEEAPHRITLLEWRADLGPGVIMREATPADTAAMAEIERQAPIVSGDVSHIYDRGDDFLSFTRLMEENVCFVVEKDGEILGLYACAAHSVRCEGEDKRAMLFHHLRVPAAQEKRGFFSALNMRIFDHYAESYGPWWKGDWFPYAYMQVTNAAAQRLGGPGSWSFGPFRALLDCESLAGEECGTIATPQDAERIVDVINACHDQEVMYVPYTVETLTERLERAPDLYTWDDFLVDDGAVIGVWASGLRVTTRNGDDERVSVRASVLDHGFVPGGDEAFERLIRSWCRKLADSGHTELSFITSEGSPTYALLERLAFQMDPFDYKQAIPEPEDAKSRGLYVDPVYF